MKYEAKMAVERLKPNQKQGVPQILGQEEQSLEAFVRAANSFKKSYKRKAYSHTRILAKKPTSHVPL